MLPTYTSALEPGQLTAATKNNFLPLLTLQQPNSQKARWTIILSWASENVFAVFPPGTSTMAAPWWGCSSHGEDILESLTRPAHVPKQHVREQIILQSQLLEPLGSWCRWQEGKTRRFSNKVPEAPPFFITRHSHSHLCTDCSMLAGDLGLVASHKWDMPLYILFAELNLQCVLECAWSDGVLSPANSLTLQW